MASNKYLANSFGHLGDVAAVLEVIGQFDGEDSDRQEILVTALHFASEAGAVDAVTDALAHVKSTVWRASLESDLLRKRSTITPKSLPGRLELLISKASDPLKAAEKAVEIAAMLPGAKLRDKPLVLAALIRVKVKAEQQLELTADFEAAQQCLNALAHKPDAYPRGVAAIFAAAMAVGKVDRAFRFLKVVEDREDENLFFAKDSIREFCAELVGACEDAGALNTLKGAAAAWGRGWLIAELNEALITKEVVSGDVEKQIERTMKIRNSEKREEQLAAIADDMEAFRRFPQLLALIRRCHSLRRSQDLLGYAKAAARHGFLQVAEKMIALGPFTPFRDSDAAIRWQRQTFEFRVAFGLPDSSLEKLLQLARQLFTRHLKFIENRTQEWVRKPNGMAADFYRDLGCVPVGGGGSNVTSTWLKELCELLQTASVQTLRASALHFSEHLELAWLFVAALGNRVARGDASHSEEFIQIIKDSPASTS